MIRALILGLCLLSFLPEMQAKHVIGSDGKVEYLFALSANGGDAVDGRLTLTGVNSVVYFSERPNRVVGHLPVSDLPTIWNNGHDGFKSDPPNAILAVLGSDKNVVVELSDPKVAEGAVSFAVKVLSGELPQKISASTLFIDAFPTAVNSQITD